MKIGIKREESKIYKKMRKKEIALPAGNPVY